MPIRLLCEVKGQTTNHDVKGRVERANLTLQDRLVKKLRLQGISTMAAANAYAPAFIADYNRRFAKPARNDVDAHRPVRCDEPLDLIFTVRAPRRVSHSLTLQYDKALYLLAGLGLHGSARAYAGAISNAAAVVGPMLPQYPFYGGIMGIMSATGLDQAASSACIRLASSATLPFWSYIGSLFIALFIPSDGGHWAVRGPVTIPAAVQLGATLPGTSMAIATDQHGRSTPVSTTAAYRSRMIDNISTAS